MCFLQYFIQATVNRTSSCRMRIHGILALPMFFSPRRRCRHTQVDAVHPVGLHHIWESPDSEILHLQQAGSTLAQALLWKGSLVSSSWTANTTRCPSRRHWLHLAGLFTTQKSLRRYFRTKSSGSLPRRCTDMWETDLLLFLLEDNLLVFAIHQHESAIGIHTSPPS